MASCENINPRQEDDRFPTKLNQIGKLVLNSNQSQTRSTCRDRTMDPTAWLDHQRRVGTWCKSNYDANDDNEEDDDVEGECVDMQKLACTQKISIQMHTNLRETP